MAVAAACIHTVTMLRLRGAICTASGPRSFVGALAQHGWAKFDIWLVSAAALGASERVLKLTLVLMGSGRQKWSSISGNFGGMPSSLRFERPKRA